MRKFAFVLMLAACASSEGEKPELDAPEYGEDGKFDSAKSPASTVDLAINEIATASFTQKSQYRAFLFNGQKGQKVTIYVDGLKGLDTVAYLYRATTKPTGSALVSNDDTRQDGWTVRTNTKHNKYSSSIVDFVLPETRSYAVVATTYDGSTGKAEVVVKSQVGPQQCSGLIAYPACPSNMYCALPDGICGGADLPGYCQPRPEVCLQIYKPVCGCNGKTYGNDCTRQGAGAQLDHAGPCALTALEIDDAARGYVYGSAAGQTLYATELAAETADQAHPIDGYWLARDGANFVSGIHDLWAQRFTVDAATGEITVTGEH